MKIVVTGGAGYIGTSLIQALASDPQVSEVIVYDNLSRANYNLFLGQRHPEGAKVRFVHGDLLDSRKLKKTLEGVSVVYHLAAKVSTPFANTDGHMHEQVNHWGTAELVYAIEESRVEKLIYTSSTSVYGSSSDLITEKSPPNPKTLYGISKQRGEEHVARLQNTLSTYIIRLGNVFGYNKSMRFDAVINRFMFDAHFKNRISIEGNGKQWRAFVHIATVKQVLSNLLHTDLPSGTYNLVDRNLQILGVVDALKEIYPALEFIFINQHLQLSELRVVPQSALHKHLNFDPGRELKEELLQFREEFAFPVSTF